MTNIEKKLQEYKTKFKQLYEVCGERNKYIQNLDKLIAELYNDKELSKKITVSNIQLVFEQYVPLPSKGENIKEKFYSDVERSFSIKQYLYYFHSSKLRNFPDGYRLGYGKLINWDSLPDEVKNIYHKISELNESPISKISDEMWKRLSIENQLIFNSPHEGQWLEIEIKDTYGPSLRHEVFKRAEHSMDILRLILHGESLKPFSYAVGYDSIPNNKAWIETNIKFSSTIDYIGDIKEREHDENISRLNILVENPKKLENRIREALNYLRIGEYSSEDHNKIFYYAAGIEKLIVGDIYELSYKFALNGAFVLGMEPKQRQIIFNDLRKIYKKRSEIAHGDIGDYDSNLTNKAHGYLKNIIFKLIKLIDDNNIQYITNDKEKNTLTNYIEQIIFS